MNYEPIIVDGKHEAIISDDLWNNVQQLRVKKAILPPRIFNDEYLLTGIIRCPQCGGGMVASRTKSKAKNGEIVNRMYYVCGNFRSKGSSVCSSNSVHKQYAEEEISKRLSKILSKESILKAITNKTNAKLLNRTFPLQQQLTHTETHIQITEAKKHKYLDLYELGQLDKSLFSNRIQEIQVELNNYHTEKSRIELELVHDNTQPISFEQVQILISQFEQLLASTSLEKRKTLLH